MDYQKFSEISPCDYAGTLKRESFMDAGMKELWANIPRISGPAFTVNMVAGENLALHSTDVRFELSKIESSLLQPLSEREKDILLNRAEELVYQSEYLRNEIKRGIREVTV